MKNNSIADFVAASMDTALKSEEYKSLFGTQYKTADDKMCAKCHKDMEHCMCDSAMADDNDARSGKKCPKCHESMKDCECDVSMADDNAAKKKEKDSMKADDQDAKKKEKDSSWADDQDAKKHQLPFEKKDDHSANTLDSSLKNPYPGKQYDADEYRNGDVLRADDDAGKDDKVSSAFDLAIDSLLTASAALDSIGLGKGSALSLKLASIVVDAKKKEKDSKKSKKDDKKSSSKSSKDSKDNHSAKDKGSSSKSSKKDDKKDDKKSSKKDDKKSSSKK